MLKYLAKRVGRSILTLFIIVTLVFCLLRLMPVEGYFANYEKMTEVQIQAGLQSMGLLDPLPVQIVRFWKDALHGDLGVSHIYKVNASVTGILAKKLPISVQMGVYAMLLSLVIGIPMGMFMGRFKSRWPDKIGTAIIVLIQAVPSAVYYLYIQMYGTTALGVGLLFDASNWKYWVLPVCSMSLGNIAFYAMWLRRYMVDESNKDYVRLARAKGVSENKIALKHIFRNAMVPLVQYIPASALARKKVADNAVPHQRRKSKEAGSPAEQTAERRSRCLGQAAGRRAVHPRRVPFRAGRSHGLLQLQLLGQHVPRVL